MTRILQLAIGVSLFSRPLCTNALFLFKVYGSSLFIILKLLNELCFPIEIIDHLIVACPKIEKLHIGKLEYVAADRSSLLMENFYSAKFLSAIEFSELKSLSFDGFKLFDGSYMPSVTIFCALIKNFTLN